MFLPVGLVVLVVVVVPVLDKLCFDALSSPSVTSAPDRVFKLRQSQDIDPSSNSFCCSCLAVHNALIESSKTVSCTLARAPLVSPPFGGVQPLDCISIGPTAMGTSTIEAPSQIKLRGRLISIREL